MITHANQLRIGGTYRFTYPQYAKDYGNWTLTSLDGGLWRARCVKDDGSVRENAGMVYEHSLMVDHLACVEVNPEPDETEAFFV